MDKKYRWQQRMQNFEASLRELRSAIVQTEYTNLERAGLIQLFEISFELAWKTLRDLLIYEGYTVNSPRETIRQAFAFGILENAEKWLEALDSRNLLTHTYNEQTAADAVESIKNSFAPMLFDLQNNLKERL